MKGVCRLFLCILISLSFPLYAQNIPSEPILVLSMEMHTASIRGIASDAQGRYLLTASDDKTGRLWDAASGKQLKVFRVPIAPGNEGKLFSAALSPDGRTAAFGGWTHYGGASGYTVFFFDTASGIMNARVSGFGSTILDMSFSPDGRYLAASLGGSSGAAIVDVRNAKLFKTLDGYGSKSKGIAFSQDGHLATTSYDGNIRLYARDFTLIKSVTPAGGKEPDGLSFSPDGKRLAVGYNDTSSVLVLDALSLSLLYEADTKDASRNLSRPVWSPDGSFLYAGGTSSACFDNLWWFFVRRWEQSGRGGYTDYPATTLNIWGLSMLPNGNLAAAGAAPNLSMLSPSGTLLWSKPLATLDYNVTDRSHLRLSSDGRKMGATSFRSSPFQFNAAERVVLAGASQEASFRDSAGNMIFTDWKNTISPKLNGTPLAFLQTGETVRTVSVRADGRFAVLGTGWAVYGLGPDGKQAWRIPSPADTWAVNIAGNGQVFTAAYGDGTIRWHRVSDGKEILAFFFHADKTRWVLWTPSGYYDASPGGEELIGWHINRSLDGTPDFYPASTFRDRFYRPDVVQEVLLSFDEARAVETANQRRNIKTTVNISQVLPPTVRILSPSEGTEIKETKLSLEVEVSASKDAPLTELQVRLNGRLLADARGIAAVGTGSTENRTLRRVEIDLSKLGGGEAVITVQAANQHGFGPAAEVSVRLSETRFKEFTAAPKLYVLAVGVSRYRDSSLDLRYAAKDAQDVAEFFRTQAGGLYREVEVRLLTDQQATLSGIRDGLFWLEEQVTSTDSAQIFIAGHGINDNTGQLYFTPHDVDVSSLRRTGLPASDIVKTIAYLQGRVVYFMDTCHSGNLDFVRRGAEGVDLNRHIQDLSSAETGAVVFSSAAGSQYALESAAWGNGAFTKFLISGLKGTADYNRDGAVSINELNLYVSEEVKKLTNNQQTPVMMKPGSIRDFPLSAVR